MNNALTAATVNVESALAEAAATSAVQNAELTFRESALAFAEAIEAGVKAAELARTVKQVADERNVPKGLATLLYTSPAAVLYHARTGSVLALGGDLPEGVTAREIQTLVKGLPAKTVDEIVDNADDIETAVLALIAATRKADQPVDETDDETDSEPNRKPEKGFADYIKAAAPLLAKARETVPADITDADRALLAAITDHVAFIQSVVTHADIVEDALV